MGVAVLLQTVAVLIGAGLAWAIGGRFSAWCFLLGGAAAVVPNALFALRLATRRDQRPEAFISAFFFGEFIKVGLSIASLGAIVKFQPDASWFEVILGLIVGLKAQLFALWLTGDRSDRVIREAEQARLSAVQAQERALSGSTTSNQ